MSHEKLAKVVNDRSRRIHIRGKRGIVPLKFDKDGKVADPVNRKDRMIFKQLTLADFRFLEIWQAQDYLEDLKILRTKTGLSEHEVTYLIKKLSCFKEEAARTKALCEIPTVPWIKAKHVESLYSGPFEKLCDADQKSLQELAKIEGAYKNNLSLNVTQNVFNLPKLTPEVEAEFKALAEKALEAEIVEEKKVA